ELLMFIHERVRETGVPPSFDEMKDALDLKSKSGIHRLITALEERGFLKRLEKRARALEIVRLPENVADTLRPATSRTQAQRLALSPGARRGRGASAPKRGGCQFPLAPAAHVRHPTQGAAAARAAMSPRAR